MAQKGFFTTYSFAMAQKASTQAWPHFSARDTFLFLKVCCDGFQKIGSLHTCARLGQIGDGFQKIGSLHTCARLEDVK